MLCPIDTFIVIIIVCSSAFRLGSLYLLSSVYFDGNFNPAKMGERQDLVNKITYGERQYAMFSSAGLPVVTLYQKKNPGM